MVKLLLPPPPWARLAWRGWSKLPFSGFSAGLLCARAEADPASEAVRATRPTTRLSELRTGSFMLNLLAVLGEKNRVLSGSWFRQGNYMAPLWPTATRWTLTGVGFP